MGNTYITSFVMAVSQLIQGSEYHIGYGSGSIIKVMADVLISSLNMITKVLANVSYFSSKDVYQYICFVTSAQNGGIHVSGYCHVGSGSITRPSLCLFFLVQKFLNMDVM